MEYYIFPPDKDKEDLLGLYNHIKSDLKDESVYGYSKFFNKSKEYEWRKCKLVNFDDKKDIFYITFDIEENKDEIMSHTSSIYSGSTYKRNPDQPRVKKVTR